MNLSFLSVVLLSCSSTDVPLETFDHSGSERQYLLDVPDSYDGSSAVPLILNFHGGCMDAASQRDEMDMRALASEHNFILVYPQGLSEEGRSSCAIWNSGPFNSGDNKSQADDLGFVEALIAELSSTYSIDMNRIYATGFSNGGFFTYALGCYRSELFAAIAPIAALMTEEALNAQGDSPNPCTPLHPMSVVHLHGSADSAVAVAAGETAVEYWRTFNNTTETTNASQESSGQSIEYSSFTGGDNGTEVAYYNIIGGQHSTFDDISYEGQASPQLVWNFVSRFDIEGIR